MVLKKTLESLMDCKEIQSVYPKGDQPFGRTDAKADTPILWPPRPTPRAPQPPPVQALARAPTLRVRVPAGARRQKKKKFSLD